MTARDDDRAVAHLFRRAGFGLTPATAEAAFSAGVRRCADALIDGLSVPPPPDPGGFDAYEPGGIQRTWLTLMLTTPTPLAEKLTLFWHGHFATSDAKLREPQLMWNQRAIFRRLGAGVFADLAQAVTVDPAMIRWLDQSANRRGAPNENYARELMELFTLGIGNYSETDVREAARAFTGQTCEGTRAVYHPEFHDDGAKTLLGQSGRFVAADVIKIVTGLPRCGVFICTKLVKFFACPDPTSDEVAPLVAVWQRTNGDVKSVLHALFTGDFLYSARCTGRLIKSPVEFLITALRAAAIDTLPDWAVTSLTSMGQTLFQPPSVKGWTGDAAWLSSGGLVERLKAAERLVALAKVDAADATRAAFGTPLTPTSAPAPGPAASRVATAVADNATRMRLLLAGPAFQAA